MSEHMKQRHTEADDTVLCTVIIKMPGEKGRRSLVPARHLAKLEDFLEKYAEAEKNSDSIEWEELAADRIAKYSKAGLALRGARYREGLSQKDLAELTGISQENISKMENGKRSIGAAVTKKLAYALRINVELLFN